MFFLARSVFKRRNRRNPVLRGALAMTEEPLNLKLNLHVDICDSIFMVKRQKALGLIPFGKCTNFLIRLFSTKINQLSKDSQTVWFKQSNEKIRTFPIEIKSNQLVLWRSLTYLLSIGMSWSTSSAALALYHSICICTICITQVVWQVLVCGQF